MSEFRETVSSLTVAESFSLGTNSRTAKRIDPVGTRKLLLKGLNDMLRFIDANKTIENEDDLLFTVDCLLDDFPAMNIEEFLMVFNRMKKGYYGKYYERLKLPEISECCKKYEGEDRVRYLEQRNEEQKIEREKMTANDIAKMYEDSKKYFKDKEKREKEKKKNDDGYSKYKADYLMKQKQENDTAQEAQTE